MDAFEFIGESYAGLSKNEKRIVDYIMNNPDGVYLGVKELCEKCSVSVATPVRLSKKLGFSGFSEFRMFFIKNCPEHREYINIESESSPVSDAVNTVLEAEIESIRLTLSNIKYSSLYELCERIQKAQRILFFGTGTSYLVCQDIAMKFQRLEKCAFYTSDKHQAAVIMSAFSENDIVIVFSHSGENDSVIRVLDFAKKLGIFSGAFASFETSRVYKTADLSIKTQTRESPSHKIAFASRTSQLAMGDALFMSYFSLYQKETKKILLKTSENFKKI